MSPPHDTWSTPRPCPHRHWAHSVPALIELARVSVVPKDCEPGSRNHIISQVVPDLPAAPCLSDLLLAGCQLLLLLTRGVRPNLLIVSARSLDCIRSGFKSHLHADGSQGHMSTWTSPANPRSAFSSHWHLQLPCPTPNCPPPHSAPPFGITPSSQLDERQIHPCVCLESKHKLSP